MNMYSSRIRAPKEQLHKTLVAYGDLFHGMDSPIMRRSIKQCGLCARAVHALLNRHIETIGDLMQLSRYQILKIRNLGVKCADEIEDMLKHYGLRLES